MEEKRKPRDAEGRPLEIERKFLISCPDVQWLKKQKDVQIAEIEQYYFDTDTEKKLRVRSWKEGGRTRYILTKKTRITDLTRVEEECEISKEEFDAFLAQAPEKRHISKTRYRFPYQGKLVEVDIFPFWDRKALAEVELESEEEEVKLPEELKLIREVTQDRNYTNYSLAR